jgi:hypothetical protein
MTHSRLSKSILPLDAPMRTLDRRSASQLRLYGTLGYTPLSTRAVRALFSWIPSPLRLSSASTSARKTPVPDRDKDKYQWQAVHNEPKDPPPAAGADQKTRAWYGTIYIVVVVVSIDLASQPVACLFLSKYHKAADADRGASCLLIKALPPLSASHGLLRLAHLDASFPSTTNPCARKQK